MVTPAHTRVTISGVFGPAAAPLEEWSWNLSFAPMAATTVAADQAAADQIAAAYATSIAPLFPADIVRTKLRVANLDGAGLVGRDADGTYHQADNVVTAAGTGVRSGSQYLPPQCALVVSLQTTRPGSSGKGRFFLPFPTTKPVQSDYRLTAADAQAVRDACRTFLNASVAAVGQPLVVASSKGFLSNVTTVRVGRAVDTQRSRRIRIAEGYVSVAL